MKFSHSTLKQSNDRLNALIAATSDVVYRMSHDWIQMYNLKGGDFLSSVETPIDDWLNNFIPSDTQQEVLDAINRAISTKSKFELEHKVVRVDGSIGWTFSSAIPILDDKGGIVEWFGIAHDITDHKNAELRLQQSEERFSKAFHNIPIPATITRFSDNILIDVNHIFLQLFEYSLDEVINHSSIELNLFTDHNKRMNSIKILELDGYIRDYELEMLTRKGKKLTLLVSSESIIIQEQKHFLTTYINITERNEIERNMQLLAAIVQYTEVPIVSKDLKGNILTWNRGAEKVYGYTAEEVIGKNISILIPHGEKNEIPELIDKVLTEEKIVNYETKRRRKDGTIIPVSINLSLIKSELIEIIGVSNISYDITEFKNAEEKLKTYGIHLEELVKNRTAELEAAKNKAEAMAEALRKSEEQLRFITENVPVGLGISRIDDSKILYANPAYQEILGYSPGELINQYGRNLFYSKSDREKAVNELKKQGFLKDYVLKFKRKDGSIVWVSISAKFIDYANEPVVMGTVTDISERIQSEEELRKSKLALFKLNDDLTRSNKELLQFAYLSSHDLQEPLRTISTFTQLLSERYHDKFDAEGQQFVHYIVDSSMRMTALLHDLLIYSRAGTNPFKHTGVDFNKIIEKVVHKFRSRIQEINAEVSSDKLPTVIGDEDQLQQLLQDLVWNALKFCNSTPKIHISAKEEPGNYLFSIKDNGIGIDPQYADRIFQIFQRLVDRHEYSGTGMGLAVSKRIVERHGGKIWFESQPGEGTTFYFTIAKNISVSESESKISEAKS